MANLGHTSELLNIPLELRENIYKEVLSQAAQGPQLLRTCQEIYMEAHKFLFQRPLQFCNQSSMEDWLNQVPAKFLHHAMEMTIELEDVDLKPLLDSEATSEQSSSTPRLLAWELYEKELKQVRQSFERLPNIKTLTIKAPPERQSFLYREFLGKVLELLSSIWPQLRGLNLEGNFHHQSLSFLSSMPELEAFSFDGFSASSPADTATIFSNLDHLKSLSLVSQHSLFTPTNRIHSSFTSKSQSFTTDVVSAISRLASLSVSEHAQPGTPTMLYFTVETLTALQSHNTLTSLAITLSHVPDVETLEALEDFMNNSSIERLELDWPHLNSQVIETYALLPDRLRDLWIRVSSMALAFDILWVILEGREAGQMSQLNRVVLVRNESFDDLASDSEDEATAAPEEITTVGETSTVELVEQDEDETPEILAGNNDDHAEDSSDADNVRTAMTRLSAFGVQVSWFTEPK